MSTELAGRLVAGRYELLEKIGQGGFASVWKARQLQPAGLVAVKILSPEHARDPALVKSFLKEAELYVPFRDDPHIATVLECGRDDENDLYFLVMTLLEETVGAIVEREQGMPAERVLKLAADVGGALDTVHAAGLVHRDVKCSNIMTARGGERFVLTDFGIGLIQEIADKTITPSELSKVGSWAYAAPECIRARTREEIKPAADFYSLGVVLYRAATGQFPFPPQFPAVIQHHLETPPRDPRQLRPSIPEGLASLILRLLEKDPAKRIARGQDLIDAAERIRRDLQKRSGAKNGGSRGAAASGRGRAVAWVAGIAGGLSVLGAVVGGLWYMQGTSIQVDVQSDPNGASYRVYSGQAITRGAQPVATGTAGLPLKVKRGLYAASFEKEGYFPTEVAWDLRDKRATVAPVQLEMAHTLNISTDPDGARARLVWLNGSERIEISEKVTPCLFEGLHEGPYELSLEKDGYARQVERVDVSEETRELRRSLDSGTSGGFALYSSPPGASVSIDGEGLGQTTPCRVGDVPAGRHRLAFSLAGYARRDTTVQLDPRQGELAVRVKLQATAIHNGGGGGDPSVDGPAISFVIGLLHNTRGYPSVHVDGGSPINASGVPPPWTAKLKPGPHTFRLEWTDSNPPVDMEIQYTVLPENPKRKLLLDLTSRSVMER